MTIVFFAGIITWDDMVQTKAVWNTFIWFGAILGLSTALTKAKFFAWLAAYMQANLALDVSPLVVVLILSAISVVIRYLFASSTAYIASMLPVFLTVGMASGVDPSYVWTCIACNKCVWWSRNSLRCISWSNHLTLQVTIT